MNKAKLIKKGDIYFLDELKVGGYTTIGNSLVKPKGILYDLSLKNCQAIERGYDLDELAIDYIGDADKIHWTPSEHNEFIAFKEGFQKALEILGDKKFSEEDMERMSLATSEWENSEIEYGKDVLIKKVFKLLEKTEWQVEFNPDELDKDGCLILKRIC